KGFTRLLEGSDDRRKLLAVFIHDDHVIASFLYFSMQNNAVSYSVPAPSPVRGRGTAAARRWWKR
ncbi:MAG: hypothetical protein IKS43_02940, partial [Clostridia bacterium]|nr:hypothetical protein [Clostridia bacterium]